MKSILFYVLIYINIFTLSAQSAQSLDLDIKDRNEQELKPIAKKVFELQRAGVLFQKLNPFPSTADFSRITIPELIQNDGWILESDLSVLKNINLFKPQALEIDIPSIKPEKLTLLLYKEDIGTSDFRFEISDGRIITKAPGAHYRGIIKGDNSSLVSFSVFDEQVMCIISNEKGNYNLGLIQGENKDKLHVIYNDRTLGQHSKFTCGATDQGSYHMNTETPHGGNRDAGDCLRVYYEVDHDLYNFFGYPGVLNWVSGMANQVNIMYSNEGIHAYTNVIHVWSTNSPYTGGDKLARLQSFEDNTDTFDGDVAMLIDNHDGYGGVSTVGGLCHTVVDYRKGYGGMEILYYNVPLWSQNVYVITHEIGHLLGSYHTHACVWNGNSTQIDGCGAPEYGSCPQIGLPPLGTGTVMSYCHLQVTGINLALGFGPQPHNVITNSINNATCLNLACAPCSSCPLQSIGIGASLPCDDKGTCLPNDDEYLETLYIYHNACAHITPDEQFTVTVSATGQFYGPFSYDDNTVTIVNIKLPIGLSSTNFHVHDNYFECNLDKFVGFFPAPLPGCSNYVPPTISCPADATVGCITEAVPGVTGSAVGHDCTNSVIACTYTDVMLGTSPLCISNQNITRTWKTTDSNNGTKTCVQKIVSKDVTPPVFSACAASVTVSCESEVPPPNYGQLAVTDNCSTVQLSVLSETKVSQFCANWFDLNRIYKATDNCGNTGTCLQVISVRDLTTPTITCPANLTVSCSSDEPAVDLTSPVVSDNCSPSPTVYLVSNDVISFNCTNKYVRQRIYQVNDACSHTATCVQVITVNDVTSPTITCPANITVSCASDVPAPNIALVTSADNCAGTINISFVSDVISNQTCANRFTVTRTYRATDVCGNSATCTQTIVVNDQTAMAITCPGPVTVSCVSQVPAVNTASVITQDNCVGTITVTHLGDVISSQTCTNRYTITRTYRATDVCGNSATCSQIITVNDLTPPAITCPANITVSCASDVPAVNTGAVISSDNCGNPVTVTFVSDVISGQTCTNRYTITRTYRSTDVCGNSATCAQIILVNDQVPPTVTCPAAITVSCSELVPTANIALITASDNCSGVVTITNLGDVISNQICPNKYTLTRTYRATDVCGNSATCGQTIIVNDNIAPVLIGVPANLVLNCTEPIQAPPIVTATDNCVAPVTVSFQETSTKSTLASLCESIAYVITRTWIATDACSNQTIKTQTVTVKDTKAPQMTNLPPKYLYVECDEDNNNNVDPIAIDDCDATPSVLLEFKYIPYLNNCVNSYTAVYTWTAGDKCGNTSQYTQYIYVEDTEAPELKCPPNIDLTSDTPIKVSWIAPQGDDYCVGKINAIQTSGPVVNSSFNPGTKTIITYTVTDECGNSSTCSFYVSIYKTGSKPGDPNNIELFQNEPNPFMSGTTVKFSLPGEMYIELLIYDLNGKQIKAYKGVYKQGINGIDITPDIFPSAGMYFYQLKAGSFSKTMKMFYVN